MIKEANEVGRREMRNLTRWRHHRTWGTYKCKVDCPCRTAPAARIIEEAEDIVNR